MRSIITAISLCWFALSGSAATWYLDSAASGANNGTNWANAWNNVTSVVWGASGVKAGDTMQISGGSYPSNALTVGASGTSTSPIIVEASREVGHNSKVVMRAMSLGGNQWIVVRGAKETNVAFPYGGQIYTNQAALTNNINWQFTHPDQGVTSQGLYVNGDSGANNRVQWIEFGPIASETDTDSYDGYGIRFLNLSTNGNFFVQGCWFHDIRNDDINQNSVTVNPSGHDATVIESCWLQGGGDDGVQWSRNGLTYRNNYADGHLLGFFHGHPDHLQFAGSASRFLKIINNVMNGNANSIIKGEHLVTEGGTVGDWIIAGNWFVEQANYPTNYSFGEPISMFAWRANNSTNVVQAYMSNIYVLNNSSYRLPSGSGIPFAINRATPGDDSDSQATKSAWKIDVKNGWWLNNLGVDLRYNSPNGSAWGWAGNGIGGGPSDTNGIFYGPDDVVWANNVLAGSGKRFSYTGISYTNGESLGFGNVSTMPSLVSTNARDLRLATNDTVAVGTGYNWSTLDSLTNNHPELMVDVFGNPRFRGGVVDIGGASLLSSDGSATNSGIITTGLVMRIDFADSFSDGILTDSSPTGAAPALRFGKVASPTNWPTAITVTNPFTGNLMPAANFEWYYNDGYGEYLKSGDYAGVTNVTAFKSLNRMTVMLWYLYDQVYTNIPSDQTWTPDNNATLLAGDLGERGNWLIGRHGTDFPQFIIWTSNNAASDISMGSIVDRTFDPPYGYSRTLKHFCFTWDNGTATIFSNSVPVATNYTASVTNLVVRKWLAVGCLTHGNHDPQLDNGDGYDEWPNNGWLNGWIADARIYNWPLNRSAISNIVYQTESSWVPQGGGGGGGGGGSGRHDIRATTLSIGRIQGP